MATYSIDINDSRYPNGYTITNGTGNSSDTRKQMRKKRPYTNQKLRYSGGYKDLWAEKEEEEEVTTPKERIIPNKNEMRKKIMCSQCGRVGWFFINRPKICTICETHTMVDIC